MGEAAKGRDEKPWLIGGLALALIVAPGLSAAGRIEDAITYTARP